MTAIVLVVTAAGRAALVDAAHAGTNAVRIAAVGLTSTSFTALAAATSLPGEFGRLTSLSGATVDPATIHLVVRDDTAATYTLRGFALYLADGTMFAHYGQPAAILEKSANSTMLLAVDVRFADIAAATLTFGDSNFLNPPATTDVVGVVELATDAEAATGTDQVRAVTPGNLKSVLDGRFGAGAPSGFVKTLLAATSAALFRGLLFIKGAALKDEGHGNALDADMLDTYHAGPVGSGGNWPFIPVVGTLGYLQAGKGIDFHAASGDPALTTLRLQIIGNNLCVFDYPVWTSFNDGSGSGLDADLLDGQDSSFYTNIPARLGFAPYPASNPAGYLTNLTGITAALGYTPWHAGNDGAGSGLDADLLDGLDSTYFLNIIARLGFTPYNATNPAGYLSGITSGLVTSALGYTPWHAGNDGAGSGLDADLLDGRDSGSFANASHTHTAPDLVPAFSDQLLAETGHWNAPGGFQLRFGQVRQFISGEQNITVYFDPPFPTGILGIVATAYAADGSNNHDMWAQGTANRSADHATIKLQSEGTSNNFLDGFDWWAWGH